MLHLTTDVLTTAITMNSITPDSKGTDHSTGTIVYSRTAIGTVTVTVASSNAAANAGLIKHSRQEGNLKSQGMIIIKHCVQATLV